MNSPDEIKEYLSGKFSRYGVNKSREITRLLYEISKTEKISYLKIAEQLKDKNKFPEIKKYLLNRRFPESFRNKEKIKPYLPELDIVPENVVKIENSKFAPEKIYYDKSSSNSKLLEKIKNKYPDSERIEIRSLKEHISSTNFSVETYNSRRKNLIIVDEKYDYFKACPCTGKCVCCNYHIFNLGFGCPYECTYCYLQEYTNTPGIIIPSNLEEYLKKFGKYRKNYVRMGTGEFADSLALDDITDFSPRIIEILRQEPAKVFEFKTKSANIGNIINVEPADNVVIGWSLNHQKFIDKNEFYSANLMDRIKAAKKCVETGYDVAFHYDPIVYYKNWEEDYSEVINMVYNNIPGERIRWISLGTFRFSRGLKKIIENRFPENDILDGELVIGFDGKLRYTPKVRAEIYKKMICWIKDKYKNQFIYLCMENKEIWNESGLSAAFHWNK